VAKKSGQRGGHRKKEGCHATGGNHRQAKRGPRKLLQTEKCGRGSTGDPTGNRGKKDRGRGKRIAGKRSEKGVGGQSPRRARRGVREVVSHRNTGGRGTLTH